MTTLAPPPPATAPRPSWTAPGTPPPTPPRLGRTPEPAPRRHGGAGTSVAVGVAVLLGALALDPVFAARSWLPPVATAVVLVALGGAVLRRAAGRLTDRLAGDGGRTARLLRAVVPLVQALLVVVLLTVVFVPGHALGGLVPTPASLGDLARLLGDGMAEIREQATPALPLTGLVALTTVFVALVALAVDLLAVAARQPALGGLGLLVLYCVPVSTITGDVALIAFAAPACGFALLLWADQRERLPRSRAGTGAPLGTGTLAALRIGAVALVAGVLLPLAVPMLSEGSLARGFGNGDGDGTASTGTRLDPVAELQGQLTKPEPVDLLQVDASVPDPGYLRAVALDDYTANGWQLDGLRGQQTLASPAPLVQLPDASASRTVDETIRVLGHDDRFLPLPYAPTRVRVAGGGAAWRFDPDNATVFGRGVTTADQRYSVTAEEPTPTPEMLAAAPAAAPGDPLTRRYTELPGLAPAVTDLVGRLTADAQTPYARVMGIYDYLTDKRNGFTYSLSTEPGTSGDDLVDFLTNKTGYCEQYAGSMAVMVRAAGVPARVVLGYTAGAKRGDSRVITTDDAHSWVEVWFSGLGWIPFDPTPIAEGRAATMGWAPRADAAAAAATGAAAAPTQEQSTAAPSAELDRDDQYTPLALPSSTGSGSLTGWLAGAGAAVLLLVLALLPWAVRRRERARRLTAGAAGPLWDELLATLVDLRMPVPGNATPRQLARRLAELVSTTAPDAVPAVRTLALAEERAVYAPAGGADDGAELRAALDVVRRGLLGAAGRQERLRAALLPASTFAAAARWLAAHSPRRPRPA